MKELNDEFKIKPNEIEDEHLLQMKNKIKENNNKMDRLSSRIKNLLSLKQAWDLEQEEAIRNIYAVYQRLITRKNEYCTFIKEECSRKELSKEESFKTSNLKIKLQKLRGYEFSADIYTFRSEFEKVNSRSTPRRILPDVLKNNFLEDPALSLVKSLDNINEIWKRSVTRYGDPKMMLHKKMSTLTNFAPLWKTSNSEKTLDALIKIINLIKDLTNLAEKHNFKEKLYNGDGLERIQSLLEGSRLIRWLKKSSEDELEGEEQWSELIEFLEKEARVHHQRSLIQRTNFKAPPSKKEDQLDNKKGYRCSSHLADRKTQKTCSFCGESDYVATNGPNQTKIIQYFSCRAFVEMTPKYRFAELQKKEF